MRAAGRRSTEKAMRTAYTSPEGYHGPGSQRRERDRERLVEEVTETEQERPRGCRANGCEEPHEARGRCKRHYMKWWRFRDSRRTPPEDGPTTSEVAAHCREAYTAFLGAVGDG